MLAQVDGFCKKINLQPTVKLLLTHGMNISVPRQSRQIQIIQFVRGVDGLRKSCIILKENSVFGYTGVQPTAVS